MIVARFYFPEQKRALPPAQDSKITAEELLI